MASKELRFDVSALDQASRTFTRMGQAVERFEKRLDRLDGKRVEAELGVKTDKAEREVGAFATTTRRRLQAALSSLPEIEIDANSTPAQREVARIRDEMASSPTSASASTSLPTRRSARPSAWSASSTSSPAPAPRSTSGPTPARPPGTCASSSATSTTSTAAAWSCTCAPTGPCSTRRRTC
ncbi:hypothetical protein [Pseudonocardia alni]|uniref:hypothetical protein n=1 Tax=Pseudonocardia alni TaxID=33907 RepID=UPI0027988E3A|nr:hypothetical protein PaSha_28835 [Pseudonocardia alni]